MDQQVLSRSQTYWIWLGLFQSTQPKIKYQKGKSNVASNALRKGQPWRQEDQEYKQAKTKKASIVEMDSIQIQDQDQ